MRWIMLVFVGLLGLLIAGPLDAATRVGLFHTEEELAIWNNRRVNGPYKTAGDAQIANSPGDWTRILANANAFVAGTTERWNGNTSATCYTNANFGSAPRPNPSQGRNLRDAAFVSVMYEYSGDAALIAQVSTYRTPVINELLAITGLAGTQWAGSRWTCTGMYTTSANPAQELAAWTSKLVIAYDYVKGGMTGGQVTTMNNWLMAYVTRFRYNNYDQHIEKRWPNRTSDDYTTTGPTGCTMQYFLYYQGPQWCEWHRVWNNQTSHGYRSFGLIAIVVNDAPLKAAVKRLVKEFVRYQIWPNGTIGDSYRWDEDGFANGGSPCSKGFGYPTGQLGGMLLLAEAFARTGDMELYTYTTTGGAHGTTDTTTSKSLLTGMTALANQGNGSVARMGTRTAAKAADVRYRIDYNCSDFTGTGEPGTSNWHAIADTYIAIGNRYYKSPEITQAYRRLRPGDNAYNVNPPQYSGNGTTWEGPDAVLPGVMFLWGQMENQVDPYNLTVDTTIPNPPTAFTATMISATQINLAWTKTALNTPASGGGAYTDPGGYRIRWCQGISCNPATGTTITLGDVAAHSHAGLTSATIYRYDITTFDVNTNFSTVFTPVQQATTGSSPPPTPVGYWPMDENTGVTANDSTANNFDGTLTNGTAWVTGEINSAIRCDGTNDYVTVADAGALDIIGDLTIAFWLKLVSTANMANIPSVLSKVEPTANEPTPYHIELFNVSGTPRLRWWHNPGAGSSGTALLTFTSFPIPVNPATFDHVTFVRNATARTVKLYVNGNVSQTLSYSSPDDAAVSTGALTLCNDPTLPSTRYANIALDEVRIYNGILDDANIASLAQGTPAGSPVLGQAAWCTKEINVTESTPCRGPLGRAGAIVANNQAELRTAIANTSATDGAGLSGFALYCRSPAVTGATHDWWALDGNCNTDAAGGHPLCYGFSVTRASEEPTAPQLTVGGSNFLQGGKFYETFGDITDQVAIDALSHIERQHAVRVRPDVVAGTTFGCCERYGNGTALDTACGTGTEALLRVTAPFGGR